MTKGYVIFTETIHDPEGMKAYGEVAATTLAGTPVRPLVVASDHEVVEGEWPATQTVVLEFESVEAARAWYTSDGYQAAAKLRQAAASTNVVIVPGL